MFFFGSQKQFKNNMKTILKTISKIILKINIYIKYLKIS